MFQQLLLKKMLEKQLGTLPNEDRERFIKLVTDNPELVQKMAVKMQDKIKNGKNQISAARDVFSEYKNEIEEALNN